MVYEVKLSCSCGTQMIYSEQIRESYQRHISYETTKFLDAHKACREKPKIHQLVLPRSKANGETA